MKTIFENTGSDYTRQGNYLLPNHTLSDETEKQIGVWGNEAQMIPKKKSSDLSLLR